MVLFFIVWRRPLCDVSLYVTWCLDSYRLTLDYVFLTIQDPSSSSRGPGGRSFTVDLNENEMPFRSENSLATLYMFFLTTHYSEFAGDSKANDTLHFLLPRTVW